MVADVWPWGCSRWCWLGVRIGSLNSMVALLALAAASFMVAPVSKPSSRSPILFLVGAGIGRACQCDRAPRWPTPPRAGSHRGMAAIALGVTAAALVVIATNLTHLRVDPRFTPDPAPWRS